MNKEKISIVSGGENIRGTLISRKTRESVPGVLLVHGWKGSETRYIPIAEELTRRFGVVCLTINLRGHGNSDGRDKQLSYSRLEHLRDVIEAYDFLSSLPNVNLSRIGGFGTSYGAYLLALLRGIRQLNWLAFRAPALYPDRNLKRPPAVIVNNQLRKYRWSYIWPSRNKALLALKQAFTGDLLIIGGELDEDVPEATLKNFYRAAVQAKSRTCIILQGADHTLSTPEAWERFNSLFLKWAKERLA